jgi:hypothetical protein
VFFTETADWVTKSLAPPNRGAGGVVRVLGYSALQLNLSGEMAGITGVDHELNSALPIPPWTLAIPATFAKSLGVCVLRVNG